MSTFDPGRSEQGSPDQPGNQSAPPPDYSQQQPGGFANAPQYSGGHDQPAAPAGPPPKEVRWATFAMYAAVALSLLGLLVGIIDSAGYKDSIRAANVGKTTVDIDALYTAAIVFGVVVTLLVAALYIFLARQLLNGKNWARITTFIVVGLFTLLGLLGLGGDAPTISRLVSILVLVANASVLVLLALKPSGQFFASRRTVH